MFITKRKHNRLMKIADNYSAHLSEELRRYQIAFEGVVDENQRMTVELAAFREKRARANANLIPGAKKREAGV